MYITNDRTSNSDAGEFDQIKEYDLKCPFNNIFQANVLQLQIIMIDMV